jgi:hypothetical protein
MLKPSIRKPVHALIDCGRFDSGEASDTAANAPATAKAPPNPCKARAPMTTVPFGPTAISNDARANNPIPAVDDFRAPNRSAASPPRMMNTAAASR